MNPLEQMLAASVESQRGQAKSWRETAKQDRAKADMHLRWGQRELAALSLRNAERCDAWASECDQAADDFERMAGTAVAA
jgi:hypothetical protein